MKVALLSGKGGAGKTLLAVNLTSVDQGSTYVDCDVEEPNGHLFFKPEIVKTEQVKVKMPRVNDVRCVGCRICTDFCHYNALAYVADKVLLFEEVCHSCGGCKLLCPVEAISEVDKEIGKIQVGKRNGHLIYTGTLNIGEATGVPIINRLNQKVKESEETVYIDCPPGSACVVMESIKEADYCVIVAEPTIFGVHNMKMVHELVEKFNKPLGIVINKSYSDDNPAKVYCKENGLNILGEIPYSKELGYVNSKADIVALELPEYKNLFEGISHNIRKEVGV
jgi:MinD superfamily P-loop ATPase